MLMQLLVVVMLKLRHGSVRQQTDRLTPEDLRESNFELDGSVGMSRAMSTAQTLQRISWSPVCTAVDPANRDQIVREFQQTKKGGAVIGTRGRARTPYVIKVGDKLPSADYVRRKLMSSLGRRTLPMLSSPLTENCRQCAKQATFRQGQITPESTSERDNRLQQAVKRRETTPRGE